jgi:hypothetical protein
VASPCALGNTRVVITYRYRWVDGVVRIDGEPVYAGRLREVVRPEHAFVIPGRGPVSATPGSFAAVEVAGRGVFRATFTVPQWLNVYPEKDQPDHVPLPTINAGEVIKTGNYLGACMTLIVFPISLVVGLVRLPFRRS